MSVSEIAWVYMYIFAQCYPACTRPTEVKQLSTVEVYKNGSLTNREQTAMVYSGFPNKHSRRGDTQQRTRDGIKRMKEYYTSIWHRLYNTASTGPSVLYDI